MKKVILIAVAVIAALQVYAQSSQLSAVYSYSTFYIPGGKPYVETYLSFDGSSLTHKHIGTGRVQATVEVVLMVQKCDSVVHFKKYNLNGPIVSEDDNTDKNFIDLQRFALDNGIYNLTISLKDKNSDTPAVEVTDKIVLCYDDKNPCLSSVQPMVEAVPTKTQNILSRNGYDMVPYINDFYPEQLKVLSFYYEIYNIQKEVGHKEFLTTAYIEQKETGRRFEQSVITKKHNSNEVVPVYGSLDISQLPSGNYNLVVEARNRDNELMLFHKVPFQRSNPSIAKEDVSPYSATFAALITNENTMNYYLMALYPIANAREENQAEELARKPGLMEQKQAFFYNFWCSRNKLDPEGEWRKYRERLDYVDATFSYPKTPGYLTDRGRVYLQYGAPDFVRDEKNFVSNRYLSSGSIAPNPSASINNSGAITTSAQGQIFYLPYQLWRYNQIPGDDGNRVFIFWDEFRNGFYKLLQSNAKGEVMDPLWERRLCQQQLNENVMGEVGEQFIRGY